MQKKQILFLIITLQVLILMGVFIKAFYPLWVGEEVKFKVLPRDPRDIFRGNYVDLNYSFNLLNLLSLPNDVDKKGNYRYGDKFYVEIAKQGDFYEPVGVWQNPPNDKKFIEVIFQDIYSYDSLTNNMNVKAGIESYFTEKENAEKLDRINAANDSAQVVVNVMLASNGKARIKTVELQSIPRKN